MSATNNIVPAFNASLLHAGLVASLLFAFEWRSPELPPTPLIIKGQVIAEGDIPEPLPLEEPPPPEPEPVVEEPEPVIEEPEPVVEEPEPEPEVPPEPVVDPEAEARAAAEEAKRQEDLRLERERIAREEEAERRRQAEAEAERKRREEAELERQRQEAERRRQEEIERQRLENERRREEEAAAERQRQLQHEIDAEQQRLDAMNAGALERYVFALRQKIERNWVRPPSAVQGTSCTVSVRQLPGGEVVGVTVESCNGDEAVRRSVEAAVFKASPLPQPEDPSLFDRNLRFLFEPTQ